MIQVTRQGMVKTVTVREYEDEAKYIRVSIKAPTELPVAAWQSSSSTNRHVDEIDMAFPLDVSIRPGDLVAIRVEIVEPYIGAQRFQGALEAGTDSTDDDDVLDVMVEESMIDDDNDDDSGADVDGAS